MSHLEKHQPYNVDDNSFLKVDNRFILSETRERESNKQWVNKEPLKMFCFYLYHVAWKVAHGLRFYLYDD